MVEQQQWTDNTAPVAAAASTTEDVATQAKQAMIAEVRSMKELPNLTIAEGISNAVKDKSENKAEKTEKFDKFGKYENVKELPLNNQEQFMLKALMGSIKNNDLQGTSDALAALSDNLGSAHRVLSALRSHLENKSTSVTFQTGKDQDGKPFVQLQVDHFMHGGFRATNNGAESIPPHYSKPKPEFLPHYEQGDSSYLKYKK